MKTLVELGFSKNLAIRELDALIKLSTNKYKKVPVSDSLVIVETKKPIDWQWIINQSGSLVRSCELLAQKSDLEMAKKFVGQHLKDQAKVYFSAYSFPEVENLIPQIKDELKEVGQNPRYISSENSLVSPLTITAKKIHEFVFIGTSPIEIYKTTHVSPSKDWKIRDRGRPSVDHAAGILPPKIARTLLNLSLTHKGKDQTILDPFCGSGTIVNEALVSGFKAIGSDVSEQAIKDSQENVQWLEDLNQIKYSYQLIHSSAQELKLEEEDFLDAIVTEGHLGPNHFQPENLPSIMRQLTVTYKESLQNLQKYLKPNHKIVLCLPKHKHPNSVKWHKALIDLCENSGYTHSTGPLVYSQPKARVKRTIYVLKKSNVQN